MMDVEDHAEGIMESDQNCVPVGGNWSRITVPTIV
jgi:hypothetical protein